MDSHDEQFFKALGTRITQARKAQGLTQTQLGDLLGIAQQTLAHYEGGRLRFPASVLPKLAQQLGVTVDDLLGEEVTPKAKRGPIPRLQQQIEAITQLPKTKQRFVMEMLDTVLAQASH